jgi:cytochrome c-type biogenesis protein CcmF
MNSFGDGVLILALVTTVYAVFSGAVGARGGSVRMVRSAERSLLAAFVLISLAILSLAVLFIQDEFLVEYVAGHSNRDLPLFFKVSALWSGQQGSLLFWSWLLSGYAFLVVLQNRHRNRSLMPWVVVVLGGTLGFFLILNNFISNPFAELRLVDGNLPPQPFTPQDGRGLNPLLQHPAMLIHPPILYLGYIGFIIPFAFAVSAMMTRDLGDGWIRTVRRWTLAAWLFQGVGILLGGRWAYVELGWGGYWAWDPVENASLMPWLTGTAFLHTVIVAEKKRMLRVWTMVLVIFTYLLCIFGTFLTRSGVMSSVHAFAKSPIGPWFAGFLTLSAFLSFYLLFTRLDYLRSSNRLESVVSREAGFLLNNLVLLVMCFGVLAGTLFPVLSEWVQGTKISVGPPFFNMVQRPLGLLLLFLMGVGPLFAWRRTSTRGLRNNFSVPLVAGLVAGLGIGAWMLTTGALKGWVLLSVMICTFVTVTVVIEFERGIRARMRNHGEWFGRALVNLTLRNTRRYGGYLAHFGLVLIFIGFTGSAFNREMQAEVSEGSEVHYDEYTFHVERLYSGTTPNYAYDAATVAVYDRGRRVAELYPSRRLYLAREQPASEVSMYSTLNRDIYAVISRSAGGGGSRATLTVYINPLVNWIWIGGFVMALGTGICFVPSRRGAMARRSARPGEDEEARKAAG